MAREVSPEPLPPRFQGFALETEGLFLGPGPWTLSSGLQGARGSKLRPWSHHRWIRHLGCSQSGTSLPQRLVCRGLRQAAPGVSILRSRAGHTRGGSWGAEVKNTTKPSPSARPQAGSGTPAASLHLRTRLQRQVLSFSQWLGRGWEEGMGHRGQSATGPEPTPQALPARPPAPGPRTPAPVPRGAVPPATLLPGNFPLLLKPCAVCNSQTSRWSEGLHHAWGLCDLRAIGDSPTHPCLPGVGPTDLLRGPSSRSPAAPPWTLPHPRWEAAPPARREQWKPLRPGEDDSRGGDRPGRPGEDPVTAACVRGCVHGLAQDGAAAEGAPRGAGHAGPGPPRPGWGSATGQPRGPRTAPSHPQRLPKQSVPAACPLQ